MSSGPCESMTIRRFSGVFNDSTDLNAIAAGVQPTVTGNSGVPGAVPWVVFDVDFHRASSPRGYCKPYR